MYVCLSVCLSFMHYYTIHPIAMKLWEVVEYTPAKVSGRKKVKYRTQGPHNQLGSKMNGNGKQNEGRNGNRNGKGKEREREAK